MEVMPKDVAPQQDLWSDKMASFSCTVERYQQMVWAVAYAATGDKTLSDDVTQETFLALWKQQDDLQNPGKLRGYLASIARNLGRTSAQRAGREIASSNLLLLAGADDASSPLEEILDKEQRSRAQDALAAIPIASREAFVLYYAKGKSIASVAVDLDLSESAVKQRLYRARESLKEELTSPLSRAIAESKPGKAFCAATMALIGTGSVSTASASAATAGASAAAASSVGAMVTQAPVAAETALIAKPAAAAGLPALLVKAASLPLLILVASATVVGLVVVAPWSPDAEDAAADSKAVNSPQKSAAEPAMPTPLPIATEEGEAEAEAQPQSTAEEIDQPLIIGRLLLNTDADSNQDSQLSRDELAQVKARLQERAIDLIVDQWESEDTGTVVACEAVGEKEGSAYETSFEYDIDGLRARYQGRTRAELGPREWLAGRMSRFGPPGAICFQLYTRYQDRVRTLKAITPAIDWYVARRDAEGQLKPFAMSGQQKKELEQASTEAEAEAFATRWKVSVSAFGESAFYSYDGVTGENDDFFEIVR
jgi:RNA polymerase sigma factor (sigma-70 family)